MSGVVGGTGRALPFSVDDLRSRKKTMNIQDEDEKGSTFVRKRERSKQPSKTGDNSEIKMKTGAGISPTDLLQGRSSLSSGPTVSKENEGTDRPHSGNQPAFLASISGGRATLRNSNPTNVSKSGGFLGEISNGRAALRKSNPKSEAERPTPGNLLDEIANGRSTLRKSNPKTEKKNKPGNLLDELANGRSTLRKSNPKTEHVSSSPGNLLDELANGRSTLRKSKMGQSATGESGNLLEEITKGRSTLRKSNTRSDEEAPNGKTPAESPKAAPQAGGLLETITNGRAKLKKRPSPPPPPANHADVKINKPVNEEPVLTKEGDRRESTPDFVKTAQRLHKTLTAEAAEKKMEMETSTTQQRKLHEEGFSHESETHPKVIKPPQGNGANDGELTNQLPFAKEKKSQNEELRRESLPDFVKTAQRLHKTLTAEAKERKSSEEMAESTIKAKETNTTAEKGQVVSEEATSENIKAIDSKEAVTEQVPVSELRKDSDPYFMKVARRLNKTLTNEAEVRKIPPKPRKAKPPPPIPVGYVEHTKIEVKETKTKVKEVKEAKTEATETKPGYFEAVETGEMWSRELVMEWCKQEALKSTPSSCAVCGDGVMEGEPLCSVACERFYCGQKILLSAQEHVRKSEQRQSVGSRNESRNTFSVSNTASSFLSSVLNPRSRLSKGRRRSKPKNMVQFHFEEKTGESKGAVNGSYKGYLNKRAIGSGINWKRRYFVLAESELNYYAKKGDSEPKGKVYLSGQTVAVASETRPHAIEIRCINYDPTCSLFVQCENEFERKGWLNALTKTLTKVDDSSEDEDHAVETPIMA